MSIFDQISEYSQKVEVVERNYISEYESELQRTEKWHEDRRGKFTGSKFKDLMSEGRGNQIWGQKAKDYMIEKVVERMTGKPVTIPQTAAMRHGVEMEPIAKSAIEQRFNCIIQDSPFIDFKDELNGIAGCSPDGLILEGSLNIGGKLPLNTMSVEIKCRGDVQHIKHGGTIVDVSHPDFWQIQGHMLGQETDYCLYVNYNPSLQSKGEGFMDMSLLWQIVERSPIHIEKLKERLLQANMYVDTAVSYIELTKAAEFINSIN